MSAETVAALKLTLHSQLVGYVTGHSNGKNVFTLAPDYIADQQRHTLTLSHLDPGVFRRQLADKHPYITHHRLHPVLSNLLPEGALRSWVAQAMKVHPDSEFPLLSWLGLDLPGALVATPVSAEHIPAYALGNHGKIIPVSIDTPDHRSHFSLAGVQMKFSMHDRDGRYITADPTVPGDWIIKTPSTVHPFVPLNEYTCMQLAQLAGVDIPEIRLVDMDMIDSLPAINLPNEQWAYGIRRYDRLAGDQRVHSEDFAQVLYAYAHDKYRSGRYEQIAKLLYTQTRHGQRDVTQMAVRLLVNVLLANGDAHLKNWSLIYPDALNAELSPAYDIVATKVFISGESQYALNMADTKAWYDVSFEHFKRWAETSGIPWRPVLIHLRKTLDAARTLWPEALAASVMKPNQQAILRQHWQQLHADFRIG